MTTTILHDNDTASTYPCGEEACRPCRTAREPQVKACAWAIRHDGQHNTWFMDQDNECCSSCGTRVYDVIDGRLVPAKTQTLPGR